MDFLKLNKNKPWYCVIQLTFRNKGCSVTSRFADEVVLVMVESGAKSKWAKRHQQLVHMWRLRSLFKDYSHILAPPRVSVGIPLSVKLCMMGFVKNLICAYVNNISSKCIWFFIKTLLCKKWDPLGSNDHDTWSRSGSVHLNVVLVYEAVLAEKSVR